MAYYLYHISCHVCYGSSCVCVQPPATVACWTDLPHQHGYDSTFARVLQEWEMPCGKGKNRVCTIWWPPILSMKMIDQVNLADGWFVIFIFWGVLLWWPVRFSLFLCILLSWLQCFCTDPAMTQFHVFFGPKKPLFAEMWNHFQHHPKDLCSEARCGVGHKVWRKLWGS